MDCSLHGFSVHGIFQARVLEWVAISSSKGSSQPRDWTCVSCIGRQISYHSSHLTMGTVLVHHLFPGWWQEPPNWSSCVQSCSCKVIPHSDSPQTQTQLLFSCLEPGRDSPESTEQNLYGVVLSPPCLSALALCTSPPITVELPAAPRHTLSQAASSLVLFPLFPGCC